MHVKIGSQSYIDKTCLATQTLPGPKAKEKKEEPMSVDLSKIRVNVGRSHKKNGQEVMHSPEDIFMMEGVQPASSGGCVTNSYSLQASVSYDECCNCNDTVP